jgi:MFS family permease
VIEKFFGDLQRDAIILMTSRGVRAFAFSYLGVIFTIYLSQLGYSTMTVGFVVTTAYAASAVLTALWGYLSDRYGRKNILILLAALTIVSNLIYRASLETPPILGGRLDKISIRVFIVVEAQQSQSEEPHG